MRWTAVIVTLVVICEVGFWVLLAAGLLLRYAARRPRLGAGVLLLVPLLEIVLLVGTVIDLKNGATPAWTHGVAALYIGYTVAYGHYTMRWIDARVAHRFFGGPPPVKPPRFGRPRALHEAKLWLRTVLAVAVTVTLLQLAIWYVGEGDSTGPLTDWQLSAARLVAIHGAIALTYTLWPRKAPKDVTAKGEAPQSLRR